MRKLTVMLLLVVCCAFTRYAISDKPVPMFDQQNIFKLVLKIPITSDPIKAPNPNPHLPGMLTRFGTDFYCTIYLNH